MLEPNPSILTTRRDGVAIVTLNRPERYNAINVPMMQRLAAAIGEAAGDDAVGCVILTGSGPGFCTGQDLKVLAAYYEHNAPSGLGELLRVHYNAVVHAIRGIEKPVIAAVQGIAAGAGWSLALACDVRVAAQSAKFVPAFATLGLVPDLAGTSSLIDAVGYAKAMEFALFTESLTAQQALDFGLLNRVVPDDQLIETCMDMARRVCALPRTGVSLTKRALQAACEQSTSAQLKLEAWLQSIAAAAPGHADRVKEFTKKGRPKKSDD